MANTWVYRRPHHRIGRRFLAATFAATTRVDDRTAGAHIPLVLAAGTYTIRLRHKRTDGSDDLEAVAGVSALSVEVV